LLFLHAFTENRALFRNIILPVRLRCLGVHSTPKKFVLTPLDAIT